MVRGGDEVPDAQFTGFGCFAGGLQLGENLNCYPEKSERFLFVGRRVLSTYYEQNEPGCVTGTAKKSAVDGHSPKGMDSTKNLWYR